MKEILLLAAATLGCWIFYFYEKNKENKNNKNNMSLYYQSLNFKVLVLAIAGTLSVLIILVKRVIV